MFVPPAYRPSAPDQVRAVVREHPLAILVTNGPCAPYATHLPMIPEDDLTGDLAGITMLGHLNRANPHWSAITGGMPATAIFSGPGAYVSPANYGADPAAPTWNFIAVHVTGTVYPITGQERTLAVVRRTAALLEDSLGDGWDQAGSIDYFRSIVGGVGAFEFLVAKADAMFKLSQEQPAEIKGRLRDRYLGEPPGSQRACLGQFMGALDAGANQ